MVITTKGTSSKPKHAASYPTKRRSGWMFYVGALVALVIFWIISFTILVTNWESFPAGAAAQGVRKRDVTTSTKTGTGSQKVQTTAIEVQPSKDESFSQDDRQQQEQKQIQQSQQQRQSSPKQQQQSHLLSRDGRATVTADVRGNLGPASVVVQSIPGTDWIHDRWQAASDMHGTNIPGQHWLMIDFGRQITVDKIVIDWEAAYSDDYVVQASYNPIMTKQSVDGNDDEIFVLYDSKDADQRRTLLSVEKTGQSPGVKTKAPLHVIHTLYPLNCPHPLRYLRLHILKSAMGWGVSVWQLDVYGMDMERTTS